MLRVVRQDEVVGFGAVPKLHLEILNAYLDRKSPNF